MAITKSKETNRAALRNLTSGGSPIQLYAYWSEDDFDGFVGVADDVDAGAWGGGCRTAADVIDFCAGRSNDALILHSDAGIFISHGILYRRKAVDMERRRYGLHL